MSRSAPKVTVNPPMRKFRQQRSTIADERVQPTIRHRQLQSTVSHVTVPGDFRDVTRRCKIDLLILMFSAFRLHPLLFVSSEDEA
jgi:hypothetical protein